ncbi:MAG: DUF4474 domain-containing protein [Lachnospiraceae bacterium]|nr:DUF4474 domain-containing protein [Lachnospiraceae bacterium]
MRVLYILIGVLFLLLLLWFVVGRIRTHRAVKKVRVCPIQEKLAQLGEAISPFGYCYDHERDIFTTILHPWQREMGYCRLYDESALSMNMVIDCEPIEFTYGDSLYLIEMWKGQYGMATGAEVGIYKAQKPEDYRKGDFVFYKSVPDDELVLMSMILYKNGKRIMQSCKKHWWLTMFSLGELTQPEQLEAEIGIDFPSYGMRNAYVQGLLETGYSESEIRLRNLSVFVSFARPKSKQPVRRWKLIRRMVMRRNRHNCRRYLRLTDRFDCTLDRVYYLRLRFKILAGAALRFGKITEATRRKIRQLENRRQKRDAAPGGADGRKKCTRKKQVG